MAPSSPTAMMRAMIGLRRRIGASESEAGFVLMELLIVAAIIGILASISVVSYVGLRDRASQAAARVDVREALPAVEAFYADHAAYIGLSAGVLQANYDAGLADSLVFSGLSATEYCVSSFAGGHTAHLSGPDNPQAQDGPCPGEPPRTA